MNACEYLARVGFAALLGEPTQPVDEDSGRDVADAKKQDHRRAAKRLLSPKARPLVGRDGAAWLGQITWPDRVPCLKTWAGQVSLPGIITKLQGIFDGTCPDDLFEFRAPLLGASGIDSLSCPDAIDVGFSLAETKTPVFQRPAMELLAIYGLETLPLVSFSKRLCGFVHDARLWQFPVELRAGGYFARWGDVKAVAAFDPT